MLFLFPLLEVQDNDNCSDRHAYTNTNGKFLHHAWPTDGTGIHHKRDRFRVRFPISVA